MFTLFNDYENNNADKDCHAEGSGTTAIRGYAHAEGFGTQAYSEVIEPYFFSGDFLEAPVSYSPRKSCSKFLRRMISFILEKIFFHD